MRSSHLAIALLLVACDGDPVPDAGLDAAVDAGSDAGVDADSDASTDAGIDAAVDAAVTCSPACLECEECVEGVCVSVGGPHAIASLRSGWYHLLAIDDAQVLYVWGENDNGQLGLGDTEDRYVGTPLAGAWLAADGGSRHSCAVRADGTLHCMGANVHGQLGTGDTTDRASPTLVAADVARDMDNPWVDVASGGLHTCALKADGTVWCFGSAVAGQLGLGTPSGDVLVPARIGGATPSYWAAVSAQTRHTCGILESDRSLHCWGDGSNGQIGQGAADRSDRHVPEPVVGASGIRFASVSCGALHTCAIDEAGQLSCWGANDFGHLGLGDTSDRGEPALVGPDWANVASAFEHSCGVATSGELRCWGNGANDQLGIESAAVHSTPQPVGAESTWTHVVGGYYHSCGLMADGTTRCWGANGRGQQGGGRDIGARRPTPGPVCFTSP